VTHVESFRPASPSGRQRAALPDVRTCTRLQLLAGNHALRRFLQLSTCTSAMCKVLRDRRQHFLSVCAGRALTPLLAGSQLDTLSRNRFHACSLWIIL
jgi:hypothetical protein